MKDKIARKVRAEGAGALRAERSVLWRSDDSQAPRQKLDDDLPAVGMHAFAASNSGTSVSSFSLSSSSNDASVTSPGTSSEDATQTEA
jgi:hypothetical protein